MIKIFPIIILVLSATITLAAITIPTACGPQGDGSYILCSPIPGIESRVTDIGSYITNIYRFALMIGGIVVFSRVVYGGLKYLSAAGNAAAQSDAKDVITQAIWGLALLFGSFLILNTINPDLTNVREPGAIGIDGPSPSDFKDGTAYQKELERKWQEMRSEVKAEFRNEESAAKSNLTVLQEQR
ncbi:MAG: hypothetical protein AAB890_02300, partial [Patescibacteria group bacterium]